MWERVVWDDGILNVEYLDIILKNCNFEFYPCQFFLWVTQKEGGFHLPYWKPTDECLIQIIVHTFNYAYKVSWGPKF